MKAAMSCTLVLVLILLVPLGGAMVAQGPQPQSPEGYQGDVDQAFTINVLAVPADTERPSAPTGLVATDVTQTTVMLAWDAATDNVGVAGYRL